MHTIVKWAEAHIGGNDWIGRGNDWIGLGNAWIGLGNDWVGWARGGPGGRSDA